MLKNVPTTIPSEIRDFPEWHHGRETYAVWVLDCDENELIQKKFEDAKAHLSDYLLKPYHRQAHITIFVCGFLVENHQHNDDFTQSEVDSQIQALERAKIKSFEIEIGNLNSFASAPFLAIYDPDEGISQLRNTLTGGAREFHTAAYQPHLTVGLYTDSFPSNEVLTRIGTFTSNPIQLKVKKITLATYQAKDISGKLNSTYTCWLKG